MYQLSRHGVKRLSDGALIPPDPENKEWREYLAWVAEGNTAAPRYTPEELAAIEAARAAAAATALQRQQDIETSLPSWAEVQAAVEGVTTLAQARTVLMKLARVVYWLAKNKAT